MARKLVRTCMAITLAAIMLSCVGCSNKAAKTEPTNSSAEETASTGADTAAKEESESSVHNKETVAAEEKSESSAEIKDDSNSESSVSAEESSSLHEESSSKKETSEQSEKAVSSTTENSTSSKEETSRTEESSRKETQESSKTVTQESETHESTTSTAQGSTTTTQESSATEEPKEESSTSVPTEQSESSEVSETSESLEESSGTTEAIDEVTQARMNLEAAQAAYDAIDAEYWRILEILKPYMNASQEAHDAWVEAWNDYTFLPEDATEEEKAFYKQAEEEARAHYDEVSGIWVYQRDEVYHLVDVIKAREEAEANLKAAQAAYDEAVATYGTP